MERDTGEKPFETLQIEVSNRCNLDCIMCIRRSWDAIEKDFNIDLYMKIARSDFREIKRLVLYGFGEPFMNPNLLRMLNASRKYLGEDSKIMISTNGTFLSPEFSEKLFQNELIDELSFSVDSLDTAKLGEIRKGSKPDKTIQNLKYLLKVRKILGKQIRVGVEIVLMKENIEELPKMVERLAEEGIDYIFVSHVIPYSQDIFEKSAYLTISKSQLESFISLIDDISEQRIYSKIYSILSNISRIQDPKIAEKKKLEIWEKAFQKKLPINLPLLFKSEEKFTLFNLVDESLSITEKIAKKYGVETKLPKIFPEAKERKCPYVENNALFIRSDGKVAPCMEFAHSHPLYINMHRKAIRPIVFGDLMFEELKHVWNKANYKAFREVRRNMGDKIPWCGDCVFSPWCFFARTNERDCFTNEPGCSECLYSIDLSICNI